MRGSPILRALLALAILLALGWPLHRLLQGNAAATPVPAARAEEKRQVHLQISFTVPPGKMRVLALGQVVWTEEALGTEVERDLAIAFPKEGVDLQFELDWPAGARAAAKAELTDPEGAVHTGYVWGSGPTTEVLTFQ